METEKKNERVELKANPFRTIQIHPTRKCNLACLHCYSSSSPQFKDMLDVKALQNFLTYAYDQGFNNISISGGEPFLYKDLEALLKFSKQLGYQNTIASNGMLLGSERNQGLLEYIDLIAISVDGQKDLHDYIRSQVGAYEKMLEGIDILKAHQKAFGIIHTVTPKSWESLLWLGEFACDHGAKLLQLHPLEMYGRAIDTLSDLQLDDTLPHQTFILANYLSSKYQDNMVVQVDLLHRDYLESFPQVVHTFERTCAKSGLLADTLDTIIVEETGKITPIAYGFNSAYSIGNVHHFENNMFAAFMQNKAPKIKKLYDKTLKKILENTDVCIVNWNEMLVHESQLEALILN